MKQFLRTILVFCLLLTSLPVDAAAAEFLVPVGKVIGLQLQDEQLTVAAFDDALGSGAREAGLKIGDTLLAVDSRTVSSVADVQAALQECGDDVALQVRRGSRITQLRMTPSATEDGPRLGIYLRQGIAGIGTVTFYDPDTGLFGTLGHGVNDPKGELLTMKTGKAFPAWVQSVKKGRSGDPGQLKGNADSDCTLGPLLRNTPQGVFGISSIPWPGQPIPTADYEEIRTGPAVIRSTVGGDTVQEYSVELLKIYPEDRPDSRNFLLRVTDPALLDTTGGIVQGMSGSPICQNGKIVGAVTHVLVNDPTMGYGIYIGNMLDAAA